MSRRNSGSYAADVRNDEGLGMAGQRSEIYCGDFDARTIPLNTAAPTWLRLQLRLEMLSDAPFVEPEVTSVRVVGKSFAKLNEYDPDFVPFTCRHSCATRLLQAGCTVRAVMAWMGHRDISMTMKYAKLVPEDLVNASQLLLQKKK